jgi:hypothetical protein
MEVIVSHHSSFIGFAFVTVVFVMSVLTGLAQDNADQWLRVFTEEDSVIDVNRSSLVIEQNQVISAKFRTKLLKPEQVPGKTDIEYQTRVDSIQFSIKDRRYRISQSNLLDASGNVVLSNSSSGANGWKPLRGRTGGRLFSAASHLQPFGIWKVVSYRYASGDPASDNDPPELTSLVGSDILFNLDRVVAGKETCYAPIFDATTITNEEVVKRVGSSIKSLGIPSEKLDVIFLVCQTKGNFPSQTIMLRLLGNKALMLWEGVFLELERSRNLFLP